MSTIARPLISLALAGAVATGLAWFMYFLTHSSEMRLSDVDRVQMLDFVRLKREERVQRKDRKPDRPKPAEVPDAPPAESQSADAGATLAVSAPTAMGADLDIGRSGIGIGGDGEYLPIVKVAPIYPRRALERGITGECMVTYTVTTAGTVKDVSVVEGYCTDPIFERPSVEAALRFKYKPRVVDGQPIEVRGVFNRFYYEQEEEGSRR
jgi:protein TonB